MKKMITGVNRKIHIETESKAIDFAQRFVQELTALDTSLLDIYVLPDFLSFKKVTDILASLPVVPRIYHGRITELIQERSPL